MSKRSEVARLRRAAEAGDMQAATDLGDMLEEDGDLAGAEHWFRLAANADNMYGALSLGVVLCQKGNLKAGAEWAKKAASSTDPEFKKGAAMAAGLVGKAMLDLGDFDESEHWLKKAVAAGFEPAGEELENLQRARTGGTGGGVAGRNSGDDVLQSFEVSGVMFYDGSGHRLGPSECTLTRTRFIIDDARGGISQILLRDINGVSTPGRMVSPKMLRINSPGVAYDIYCQSKDQKNMLEAWLSRAIRGV